MNTKFFALLAVLLMFAGVMTSCDKSEGLLNENLSVQKNIGSQESSQLRSDQVYYVALKYKNAYKHLAQHPKECSWTSYTLAAAAVARGNGKHYPSNLVSPSATDYRNKINHVRDESGSDSIAVIRQYSVDYDKNKYGVKAIVEAYDTFDEAVFGLLGKRKNGNQKPCIFIASQGTTPHFIIIWDVIWGGTAATSYVNYTDPLDGSTLSLSSYEERKIYENLKKILDRKSSKTKKYNFMFFE